MEVEEIKQLFAGRTEFAVIGLTGRTGSGCTTAAKILESSLSTVDFPTHHDSNVNGVPFYSGLSTKRYNVVKKFSEVNWTPFYSIKISDVIAAYLLHLDDDELSSFILKNKGSGCAVTKIKIKNEITKKTFHTRNRLRNEYYHLQRHLVEHDEFSPLVDLRQFEKYMRDIRSFNNRLKDSFFKLDTGLYTSVFQAAGDSIRKVGSLATTYKKTPIIPEAIFQLPITINLIIKIIRRLNSDTNKKTLVVIDAIRNPHEARFFKDRYSAFYLVSVNAPDSDRKEYLRVRHKFTEDQLIELDIKESGKVLDDTKLLRGEKKEAEWIGQNVKRCVEISDIHLFNPRNEPENNNILKSQLAWYVSLILHPGLVSPTPMERVMQFAYTAKANSGCISRQVGAVITDEDNSIKAVGWNDVADGQYPCSLRSVSGVISEFDNNIYSSYELNDKKFRKEINKKYKKIIASSNDLEGRPDSYCFKDLKNDISDENNQVHTRSLHAEENAFLQITKYGGQGIKGGKLYTTASPCELCAKKAYQLGIKEIIYIDPYPGIAKEHILSIGNNPPELVQFRGAVGKAYHLLYEPILSYKDELDYFL